MVETKDTELIANGVSFWGDENVLKLTVMITAHICWPVYFKWLVYFNYIVCDYILIKLLFKKKKNEGSEM